VVRRYRFFRRRSRKGKPAFHPTAIGVAFTSNEGGRKDVYVAPFPSKGTRQPVSPGGGQLPRWSRDGRELFYLSPDNALIVVSVSATGELGKAAALITMAPGAGWVNYDVAPDGRFIALVPEQSAPAQPLTAIVNWSPAVR
jgi:hypothetical protein